MKTSISCNGVLGDWAAGMFSLAVIVTLLADALTELF